MPNNIKIFIYKLLPRLFEFFTGNAVYSFSFANVPKDSYLNKDNKISHPESIAIGKGVTIEKDAWFNIIQENKKKGRIVIEDGVKLGQRCTLSSINKITIEKNVLIGLNVYISDCQHEYKDIVEPIMYQGLVGSGKVRIKQGAWIGNNAVILGGNDITIGKNAIVGANSVVKKSVPDFTIVAGNPARIVKRYDFSKKKWVKK